MRGADVTATVAFVPRTPRAVGDLQLIVKEEREGWVLQGEKQQNLSFRAVLGIFTGKHLHKNLYTCMMHKYTVCFKHVGMVKAGTKGHFHTSSLLFSLLDLLLCTSTTPLSHCPRNLVEKKINLFFFSTVYCFPGSVSAICRWRKKK